MTDTQFGWYIAVNALVALGTLGAVFTTLFGHVIRAKFWPPVFEFDIVNPAGEVTSLTDKKSGKFVSEVRYYHLKVKNTSVWTPATHCRLHLVRIESPRPDGQLQIVWDGDVPVHRRHQAFFPLEAEIGSAVDYDLCSIAKSPTPTLSLCPIVRANNLPIEWVGETHFVCSFQLKCSQRDSEIVRIPLDWNGRWSDGAAEMRENFPVKIIRRPKA
jgi:hypothetical protein